MSHAKLSPQDCMIKASVTGIQRDVCQDQSPICSILHSVSKACLRHAIRANASAHSFDCPGGIGS